MENAFVTSEFSQTFIALIQSNTSEEFALEIKFKRLTKRKFTQVYQVFKSNTHNFKLTQR